MSDDHNVPASDEGSKNNENDNKTPPVETDSKEDTNGDALETSSVSTSSTSSSSPETTPSSDDPTTVLLAAANHKEEGNAHFKSGQLSKASRSYRQGTNLLKKLNVANTGDEQVKSLLITLQTNMSMVCLKQNKPRQSRDLASAALDVDGTHVKALYRRAAAHRKLGDISKAREDLKLALKHDPDNREVKRELLALKKEEKEKNEKEKRALKGVFSGSFLYEDKAEEEKKRAEEKRLKKKEEEEAKKKRKLQWEKEKEEKEKDGETEFPSFEEWDKKRRKAEEDKKKEKRKEEEEKRKKDLELRRQQRKQRQANKKNDSSDSDEDMLSEKELAMLRGYKKTTDGRTTSYFHRELSDGEKALIGDITPQRLEQTGQNENDMMNEQPVQRSNSTASAWNKAQTWEEKNTTEWCSNCLERSLQNAQAKTAIFKATFDKVEVKGDASFATSCGRKRYIFDFTATLQFQVFIPVTADVESEEAPLDDSDVVAKGNLSLPDVNSTVDDGNYEVQLSWKKHPKDPWADKIRDFGNDELVLAVRESVKRFVKEFNDHY